MLEAEGDSARCRVRVAAHVRQGLPHELHDVARSRGELRGHSGVHLDDGNDGGLLLEVLGQSPECLIELAIGEDSGSQAEYVVPQVADHAVDLLDRALGSALNVGIPAYRRRGLQAHPHSEERLDDAVVKLLADALAIVHDRQTLELPLGPSVFDGHRRLVGEGAYEGDILIVERFAVDTVRQGDRPEGGAPHDERDVPL